MRKRGFAEGRKERVSALDPATADTSGFDELRAHVAREGYGLVSLADVLDQPYELFECFYEAGADAPADEPWDRARYDEWRRESLERPDLTLEGTFVVVHEGKPVSLSWLEIDPETRRAANAFTGQCVPTEGGGLAGSEIGDDQVGAPAGHPRDRHE